MTHFPKITRELLVSNRCGIHLRVGNMLAQKAKEFSSDIRIRKGTYAADCRSVLDILSLGAFQGDAVVIETVGEDAQQAAEAIAELFNARFYEDEQVQ
ncbi:MAG: HPr family phosphocarrier protein [Planctomycetaceae bacterium]|jgi:phosphocarrier protein NPr/phosphocarrier protein|nr:HPr family phosphocarrier protein [Planctomycetaceae bacterium]